MPWARLDDQANGNAKLLALSDPAWRLWGNGLIYCQANLTDGFIPSHAVRTFGIRSKKLGRHVKELCSVLVPGKSPLWHQVATGFQVHDYLDWNDSKNEVLKQREQGLDRYNRWLARRNGQTPEVVPNALVNALATPLPTRTQRRTTSTALSKDQERAIARAEGEPAKPDGAHAGHLACFPVCMTPRIGSKFLGRFKGDREALQAWAQSVCAEWTASNRQPPEGDDFDFWSKRYTESFNAKPRPVTTAYYPDADETQQRIEQWRAERANAADPETAKRLLREGYKLAGSACVKS